MTHPIVGFCVLVRTPATLRITSFSKVQHKPCSLGAQKRDGPGRGIEVCSLPRKSACWPFPLAVYTRRCEYLLQHPMALINYALQLHGRSAGWLDALTIAVGNSPIC